MMHQATQIQPPHQIAQVQLALARRNGRTHRVGELLERQSLIQAWPFIQKRDSCRIPLARNQTAGVHGALAAGIVVFMGSGE